MVGNKIRGSDNKKFILDNLAGFNFLGFFPYREKIVDMDRNNTPFFESCPEILFEIRGGFAEVKELLSKLRLFLLAESLGGVESLVCYPPKMTHSSFSREEQQKRGIKDNLIRLSIDLEDKDDLKEDLENAFS